MIRASVLFVARVHASGAPMPTFLDGHLMSVRFSVMLSLVGLLGVGCATSPEALPPVFFPSRPEEPRLQFLTSYSAPEDILPAQHWFKTFLLGKAPKARAIRKPYGVAMRNKKLYICDSSRPVIHVIDLVANRWDYMRITGSSRLLKPINCDVDESGSIYVADALRQRLVVYDPAGYSIGSVGVEGEMRPVDVKVKHGRIYICERNGPAVRVYDQAQRKLLFTAPQDQENRDARLYTPTNLDVDEEGNIWVSDTGGYCVKKYDSEGKFIGIYGAPGNGMGQFTRNKGIAVDREGRIYVADAASAVIQAFDKNGNLLLYFGEPGGSRVPLVLPAGLVIDYESADFFQRYAAPGFKVEYVLVAVSQFGPRKVSVFGFGQKE